MIMVLLWSGALLYLAYWIPCKLGRKKLGRMLCSSLVALLTFAFLSDSIEELFFTKEAAIHHLRNFQVNLKDDFEIIDNECSNNLDVLYRTFELKISDRDKQSIIQQIKNAENYKDSVHSDDYIGTHMDGDTKKTIGFRTSRFFVHQSYDPDKAFPNSKIQVNILGDTLHYMCAQGD